MAFDHAEHNVCAVVRGDDFLAAASYVNPQRLNDVLIGNSEVKLPPASGLPSQEEKRLMADS